MRLSQLKGYTGIDIDLGISLYEYGLAWKYIKQDNEYRFYYRVKFEQKANDCLFDWSIVDADIDFWEEYNWINESDKISLLGYLGLTEKEFNKQTLPNKIADLVNYFGTENVFGGGDFLFPITTNQY